MEFVVHCCRTIDGEDAAAKIGCLQTPLGLERLERAVTQHFKIKLEEFGFSYLRPLVARLSAGTLSAPPRDPVPLAALLLAGALRQVEIESGGAGARDLDMDTHAAATHASLGELDTACAVRALRHAPLLADLEEATQWAQVLSTLFFTRLSHLIMNSFLNQSYLGLRRVAGLASGIPRSTPRPPRGT
jgi:hypothetical protein